MLGTLIKSVGGALGLAPSMPAFNVPPTLPNLQARTAADLVAKAGLTPPAGAPAPSTQTVAQFLNHKLNTEHDMLGATQAIAHGLPQKAGLQWATDSAKRVENKLPPAQKSAIAAAEAFQSSPSPATRAAAAAAAESAGSHGPGGLAAKAASLAAVPGVASPPGGDQLLPVCVTGAVVTAVALSSPRAPELPDAPTIPKLEINAPALVAQPAVPLPQPDSAAAAKNAAAFKPFIDRGLSLAAG